ncbi:hypothetical protein BDZ91DRAFT_762008 [Kalaharituber pfeilii]|nr:hypothetical protein BDZ91DRAFT_762008 [Kalaharituber pfeilii]
MAHALCWGLGGGIDLPARLLEIPRAPIPPPSPTPIPTINVNGRRILAGLADACIVHMNIADARSTDASRVAASRARKSYGGNFHLSLDICALDPWKRHLLTHIYLLQFLSNFQSESRNQFYESNHMGNPQIREYLNPLSRELCNWKGPKISMGSNMKAASSLMPSPILALI